MSIFGLGAFKKKDTVGRFLLSQRQRALLLRLNTSARARKGRGGRRGWSPSWGREGVVAR
eukprot:scaffold20032_cov96-Isochrysis_galbana.AAC.3